MQGLHRFFTDFPLFSQGLHRILPHLNGGGQTVIPIAIIAVETVAFAAAVANTIVSSALLGYLFSCFFYLEFTNPTEGKEG